MRPRTLSTLLLVFVFLAAPLAIRSEEPTSEAPSLRAADSVTHLDQAEDLLRTGNWVEGKAAIAAALGNLLASPLEGDGGRAILGRAMALRAIAHAGSNEAAEATFDAYAAKSFGFDPTALGLASFGKAGEIFEPVTNPRAQTSEPRRVDGIVSRPQLLSRVNPIYSAGTRKEKIQGTSILEAVINKSGRIVQANILKSLHPQLDFAALEALRSWTFEPAKFEGEAVSVFYVLTINFKVE